MKRELLQAHRVHFRNVAYLVVCKDKAFFAVADAVGADKKAMGTCQFRFFQVILPFQKRNHC